MFLRISSTAEAERSFATTCLPTREVSDSETMKEFVKLTGVVGSLSRIGLLGVQSLKELQEE